MSLRNLEQKFNERVNDLYRAATQKFDDGKVSNRRFAEPYITRRPGQGYLSRFDTRATPINSAVQDLRRISLFSLNTRGLLFLAKQQLLQTGNTFEITRLINPVFAVGNTIPFIHLRRHLRPLSGLIGKTDTSDASVRGMGQLQQSTYDAVLTKGASAPFLSRLGSSLISPLKNAVSAFTAKKNVGWSITGFDLEGTWNTSRPELGKTPKEYIAVKYLSDTKKFNTEKFSVSSLLYGYTFTGELRPYVTQNAPLRPVVISDNKRLVTKFFTTSVTYPKKKPDELIQTEVPLLQLENQQQNKPLDFISPNFSYGQQTVRKQSQNVNGSLNAAQIANGVSGSYIVDDSNLAITTEFKDTILVSFRMGIREPLRFRAYIKDINETVNPEYKSYQYIGRTEQFISYTTVKRQVSFKLHIVAFSKQEIEGVWERIKFLTGMAFPYNINRGILQPNIIRFTIGKMYVDQPAYINSISHNFNEVIETWDIDEQVPMGATATINLTLIEKATATSKTNFYGINGP